MPFSLPWPLKHADWPIYNLSVLRGSLLTHPSRSQGRRNRGIPHLYWNGVFCGHFLWIKMQQWNKSLSSFLSTFSSLFINLKPIFFIQTILSMCKPLKKLSLRLPLSSFDTFSYFQTSLWLGVDKGLQNLPKSD